MPAGGGTADTMYEENVQVRSPPNKLPCPPVLRPALHGTLNSTPILVSFPPSPETAKFVFFGGTMRSGLAACALAMQRTRTTGMSLQRTAAWPKRWL